jgi:rod shape-determining protein MreB
MLKWLNKIFNVDLGIDLGTANTLICTLEDGIIIDEPSMIAYVGNQAKEIGHEARIMWGKHADNIHVTRPLKDGVIAEFTAAEDMIMNFVLKAKIPKFSINHIVCGVPTGITPVEKRAVVDTLERSGAKRVSLVAEPMAAAIGVGMEIHKPQGSMIVDIGGGTTDIAVIAYGGIVVDNTIKLAGDELTNSIRFYFKNTYNLLIGEQTAEQLKIKYGTAVRTKDSPKIKLKGLDTVLGQPKVVEIDQNEIQRAIEPIVLSIITAVKQTLEKTPPELVSDLIDFGIVLTGGGALINGLDYRLLEMINIPVHVAENPLLGVVDGTRVILEDIERYKSVFL